jgi:hypothetical protein
VHGLGIEGKDWLEAFGRRLVLNSVVFLSTGSLFGKTVKRLLVITLHLLLHGVEGPMLWTTDCQHSKISFLVLPLSDAVEKQ